MDFDIQDNSKEKLVKAFGLLEDVIERIAKSAYEKGKLEALNIYNKEIEELKKEAEELRQWNIDLSLSLENYKKERTEIRDDIGDSIRQLDLLIEARRT